jgi:hypothetical protein
MFPSQSILEVAMGLKPPRLLSQSPVSGATTDTWRKENKACRIDKKLQQSDEPRYWREYEGTFSLPPSLEWNKPIPHRNKMCPSGLALQHPAGPTLLRYATPGYPTLTGKPWTREMMQEAVDRGPHKSALALDAIRQLTKEVAAKIAAGQARIVDWEDIQDDPPPELKISPIAMIPHESQKYCTNLVLLLSL